MTIVEILNLLIGGKVEAGTTITSDDGLKLEFLSPTQFMLSMEGVKKSYKVDFTPVLLRLRPSYLKTA